VSDLGGSGIRNLGLGFRVARVRVIRVRLCSLQHVHPEAENVKRYFSIINMEYNMDVLILISPVRAF
jgi:hypothetical protein